MLLQMRHSVNDPQNKSGAATPAVVTASDALYDAAAADGAAADAPAVDVWRVLGLCKWNMLANFYIYFVTLIVFPGLGVAVDSHNDWYGIIIIFLYNFGDFCGRMLCKFERFLLPGRDRVLRMIAAARSIFVVLFLISINPKWIAVKALPMVFMYLVGITNGYTSSQLMMFTPSTEGVQPHERPIVGSAMSLSLLAGCCGGSLVSLLLSQVYLN